MVLVPYPLRGEGNALTFLCLLVNDLRRNCLKTNYPRDKYSLKIFCHLLQSFANFGEFVLLLCYLFKSPVLP